VFKRKRGNEEHHVKNEERERELMGLTARGNVEGRIFKERDSWPLGAERKQLQRGI
jgi:hypothetical protein